MPEVHISGPSISLRFFNGFAAYSTRTSQPIRISSLKAKALLAYLAMHPGEALSRQRLARMLWPATTADGRHNVRQCLSVLQQDLKPFCEDLFLVTRETIAIRSSAISVDVTEFERYAKRGDVERAGELCSGMFLADCTPETEDYVVWIECERARLAALCCSVLRTLARLHDINHRGASAIRVAEKLVSFDPLREDWQRLLIELYARYNGRAAAINYGKKVVQLIERELEAHAEPATLTLIEAIRSGEFSQRDIRPSKTVAAA
jgi:DNA-binding SARP family transcriptional activator